MDLSLLTQSDTAECIIVDPVTGEDTDIVITLYGAYSDKYTKTLKKAVAKGKDINLIESLADITADWKNIQDGGKYLPFSRENAIDVYSKSGTIKTQVDRFVVDAKNFLPLR